MIVHDIINLHILGNLDVRHQKAQLQAILKSPYVFRDERIELEFRGVSRSAATGAAAKPTARARYIPRLPPH